jgi:hypothetical protein
MGNREGAQVGGRCGDGETEKEEQGTVAAMERKSEREQQERWRVNWLGEDAAGSGVGAALTIPSNATATRGRTRKKLYMCF